MEELAEAAGLEREEIVLALEANREVASIYQPVYERDGEEGAADRSDGGKRRTERGAGGAGEGGGPKPHSGGTACWRPSASVSAVCCNSDTTRERHSARWQNCCR